MKDNDNRIKAALAAKHATLEAIAKKIFRVATLQTRKSDSLDFYDTAVGQMKEALTEAFYSGQDSILGLGDGILIVGDMDHNGKAIILDYIARTYVGIDTLEPRSEAEDHFNTTSRRVRIALTEAFSRGRESATGVPENRENVAASNMHVLTDVCKEFLPFRSLEDTDDTGFTQDEVNVNDVRKALSMAFSKGISSVNDPHYAQRNSHKPK